MRFDAELANSTDFFSAETQLAAHHTVANKQSLAHNFRAAAQTEMLHVTYEDFPSYLTYEYVEIGNNFLRDVVAPILSFFQRRRVLMSTVRFTSSEKWVYAMPPFLAGEWVDSVAFGPEAIHPNDFEAALTMALAHYNTLPEEAKGRVRMLLLRYNELLNLPYTHERVEGLWRVVEALGDCVAVDPKVDAEYRRLLPICGAKQSSNLKSLLVALVHYGIAYTDGEVKESRAFRNHATHEYLDPALMSWESMSDIFFFLHKSVDRAIASELGISTFTLKDAAFTLIENRVL